LKRIIRHFGKMLWNAVSKLQGAGESGQSQLVGTQTPSGNFGKLPIKHDSFGPLYDARGGLRGAERNRQKLM